MVSTGSAQTDPSLSALQHTVLDDAWWNSSVSTAEAAALPSSSGSQDTSPESCSKGEAALSKEDRRKEKHQSQAALVQDLTARLEVAERGLAAAQRKFAALDVVCVQAVALSQHGEKEEAELRGDRQPGDAVEMPRAEGDCAKDEGYFQPMELFSGVMVGQGVMLKHIYSDLPRRLTHAQARNMSPEDMHEIYQRVAHRAGVLLMQSGELHESPAGRSLLSLIREHKKYLAYVSLYNPKSLWRSKENGDFNQGAMNPDLLEKLGLSEEQNKWMLATRKQYWTEMGRHMAKRQELQSLLAGLEPGYSESMAEMARQHIIWSRITRGLQTTIDNAHASYCGMNVRRWAAKVGFNQFQEAKLILQLFPHYPSPLSFLEVLAHRFAEPSAEELYDDGVRLANGSHSMAPGETLEGGSLDDLADALGSLNVGEQGRATLRSYMTETRLSKWLLL